MLGSASIPEHHLWCQRVSFQKQFCLVSIDVMQQKQKQKSKESSKINISLKIGPCHEYKLEDATFSLSTCLQVCQHCGIEDYYSLAFSKWALFKMVTKCKPWHR